MNAETARKLYQDYIETIYHERRVDQLGRFFAEDIVPHPAPPGMEPGLQGMKSAISSWLEAFSEMRFTVDSFIFQNDIMAPRITITALHTGAYLGIPASGKRVNIIAHPHYRLEHGKIAEYWDLPDSLTLLQQLGVIPTPS
jgi:steroid delta-isomerase-like uncharacterized protein